MKNLKQLLITSFFSFSILSSFGQDKIEYTEKSNSPVIRGLELSIYPIDVRMMQGLNAGPMVNLHLQPVSRLYVNASAASMLYANPYRFEYEGNNKNSFKNLGGLQAEAIGGFVFRNKGVVYKNSDGSANGKWILNFSRTAVPGGVLEETKYIPFQFNTLIQRSLRLGFSYDNFPLDINTSGQASLVIGLGKRYFQQATLDVSGFTQTQGVTRGYSFDILYGQPFYIDEAEGGGSNFGLRLLLERHQRFTRTDDLKGFTFDYQVEFGAKPGGVAYIAVKLGFPAISINQRPQEGLTYKEKTIPRKKLARFITSL